MYLPILNNEWFIEQTTAEEDIQLHCHHQLTFTYFLKHCISQHWQRQPMPRHHHWVSLTFCFHSPSRHRCCCAWNIQFLLDVFTTILPLPCRRTTAALCCWPGQADWCYFTNLHWRPRKFACMHTIRHPLSYFVKPVQVVHAFEYKLLNDAGLPSFRYLFADSIKLLLQRPHLWNLDRCTLVTYGGDYGSLGGIIGGLSLGQK